MTGEEFWTVDNRLWKRSQECINNPYLLDVTEFVSLIYDIEEHLKRDPYINSSWPVIVKMLASRVMKITQAE